MPSPSARKQHRMALQQLEYLYLDTGSFDATAFGLPFTGRLNDNVARVGVNYHF